MSPERMTFVSTFGSAANSAPLQLIENPTVGIRDLATISISGGRYQAPAATVAPGARSLIRLRRIRIAIQ
jgi:hypothetical protein